MSKSKNSKAWIRLLALFLLIIVAIGSLSIVAAICNNTNVQEEQVFDVYETELDVIETLDSTNETYAMASPMTEPTTTEPPVLSSVPLVFADLSYIEWFDIEKGNDYIVELYEAIARLCEAIDSQEYTLEAEQTMQLELSRLYSIIDYTEADNRRYAELESEYYYAAKTWEFLRQQGYSDVVASAIIGNMMIETSGGSLNLNPTIYNPTRAYYGLCQWSLYYRPEAVDMSFEAQLDYLQADMEKEFKTFGNCYYKGFTFEDFLAMTDPAEAAVAFAAVYERCGSGSYGLRRQAAIKAYNYFVLGE